jgi:hypothetical protein
MKKSWKYDKAIGKWMPDISDPKTFQPFRRNEDDDLESSGVMGIQEAPDFAALIDTTADYIQERWKISKEVANEIAEWHDALVEISSDSAQSGAFARVIGVLLHIGGDMRVSVYGLAFATGMNKFLKWNTMTAAAEGLECTRAAISKRAIQWEDMLGLKRSAHMKSESARAKYSAAQKKNHWRKAAKIQVAQTAPWETDVPAPGTDDEEEQQTAA